MSGQGGRPPPLCTLHHVTIPPPAVSLLGSGRGAGKGLEREVGSHGGREALEGKEDDVGKRRYQQRRELGIGGAREKRRGQREGKRGVILERNGRS